eukprot:scaffold36080_cov41-Attheya_sp.AAC.1
MGTHSLLPCLPGGDVKLKGFTSITSLRDKAIPVDFDTGLLVYVCALRTQDEYEDGNYVPAPVKEFQKALMVPIFLYKWDLLLVFDGQPPEQKRFEHERRKKKAGGIAITSLYIAMLTKLCITLQIPYVITPLEADMQVSRGHRKGAAAVTRDGDLVAYDHNQIFIIDSWWGNESFRLINMEEPLTDAIEMNYPLYAFYCRQGVRVLHWWMAVAGCDVSEVENGVDEISKGIMLKAIGSLTEEGGDVTEERFAAALLFWKPSAASKYTVASMVQEMKHVEN